MKTLFLCQRVPYPPDRGDRITTWHLLQHMLARGDEVRLGCFQEEPGDAAAVAFLRGRCAEVAAPTLSRGRRRLTCARGLLTGEPLTLPFFAHADLRRVVDRWFRDDTPDLVYVYSSSMAQYALDRRGAVRVMHFAELDSDKWAQYATTRGAVGRWVYGREARLLLRYETAVAREFDASIVVSDVERQLFMQHIPDVDPTVLPNGVDVDHFRSGGDDNRDPHTVIFTGVMDYEPNVDGILWFAEQCWPRLRARFPQARLLIVGSRPVPAVRALAALPGIEVTGRVPETPPFFDRAAVAIAPLRLARGVQNKVLEAMSMGLPVVSTPQAAQGLGEVSPTTLRTAATVETTVGAIAGLLDDPERARREGRAAAEWVRAHFRWEHAYERLDALLLRLGLPVQQQPQPC
ncbi:MAG: TIGR03087 family PEP-CTERM/XrtA system glycosyltransferase [Planctomycetota bacterium]